MAEEAHTTISKLTVADLDAVDELMKPNTRTIGFLPRAVLRDHLDKGWVFGASTRDGRLIGYLLYASYLDRFRVVQLCVSRDFRNKGVARQLIETLKMSATSQKVMRLRCRNDFPANSLWPKFGFVPLYETPGRSRDRRPLTLWYLPLALADQYSLFRANLSDDALDVVIDANVFFDLDEPDNEATQLSKTLLSDLFGDTLNLWFTDELLTEIYRNPNLNKREAARTKAGNFSKVEHDPLLVERFEQALKRILPSSNDAQISDMKHLAKAGNFSKVEHDPLLVERFEQALKRILPSSNDAQISDMKHLANFPSLTASSDLDIFVTNDRSLLKKAKQIMNVLNVEILSPTTVILRLNELSAAQVREPDRVAGPGLQWQRLHSKQFEAFPFDRFLEQGEKLNQLREKVGSALVDSPQTELDVLWAENRPVAFRVLTYDAPRETLIVALGRLAKSEDASLLGRFLISDAVYVASRRNLGLVKFEESALPVSLIQGLSEMGFTRCGDEFIRFCFPRYLDRSDALAEIAELAPEASNNYQSMSNLELERSCSPLTLEGDQNYFLIPIRPGYALNLFDRQQSSQDLFGGDPAVLLLWRNVYYRAATHHKMLKAPGRILWYVSGDRKEVICVSHLDEVEIDTPKELFRRFNKYGTLNWEELRKMCGGDIARKLMVLQFSHTFPLKRPVSLAEVWKAFDENGIGRSLQSPRGITFDTFKRIFQLGYPEQS